MFDPRRVIARSGAAELEPNGTSDPSLAEQAAGSRSTSRGTKRPPCVSTISSSSHGSRSRGPAGGRPRLRWSPAPVKCAVRSAAAPRWPAIAPPPRRRPRPRPGPVEGPASHRSGASRATAKRTSPTRPDRTRWLWHAAWPPPPSWRSSESPSSVSVIRPLTRMTMRGDSAPASKRRQRASSRYGATSRTNRTERLRYQKVGQPLIVRRGDDDPSTERIAGGRHGDRRRVVESDVSTRQDDRPRHPWFLGITADLADVPETAALQQRWPGLAREKRRVRP